MINGEMLSLITTSGVVGGALGFLGAIPYLKKKGINIEKAIDTADNIVKASEPIINLASTFIPGNPAIGVLKTIEKWARIAVGQAQQLYYSGTIGKDERKKVAEDSVYIVLSELKIDVTDDRKKLINISIENAVNDLGHNKTDAEKEAEKQALQDQVTKLIAENTQFKNAITTAASTVQSTIQTA